MITCSLCGSQGVNKNTCPMNKYATCPNYEKHLCEKKSGHKIKKKRRKHKKVSLQTKYNLTNREMTEIMKYAKDNKRDIESWCVDLDYLKTNYSVLASPILLRVLYLVKTGLLHRNPELNINLYNSYIIQKYRYLAENMIYYGIMKRK